MQREVQETDFATLSDLDFSWSIDYFLLLFIPVTQEWIVTSAWFVNFILIYPKGQISWWNSAPFFLVYFDLFSH